MPTNLMDLVTTTTRETVTCCRPHTPIPRSEAKAESVSCWGTGTPLREFLHADDLGEACVFALEQWSALSEDAPVTMRATHWHS